MFFHNSLDSLYIWPRNIIDPGSLGSGRVELIEESEKKKLWIGFQNDSRLVCFVLEDEDEEYEGDEHEDDPVDLLRCLAEFSFYKELERDS